jgi:hypothetical protein
MTEALSGIDDYVNISSEIGTFVDSLIDEEKKVLDEITLAIFGPEVVLGLEYRRMLREIYDTGMFVVDFLISLVNEEQIELLYKYHIPDSLLSTPQLKEIQSEIKSYAPFLKTVPVRNWRLLSRRYELGPSIIAIVRKPGESAAAALKRLKGPSDPADMESDYLRSSMDNPCFCRIHSADDTVSVLREAQIFFGAQRVRDAIRKDRGISCERLVEVIDASVPNSQEFRSPIVFFQIKLRLLYLSRANLGPLENLYKSYLLKCRRLREDRSYFSYSPNVLGMSKILCGIASSLYRLAD